MENSRLEISVGGKKMKYKSLILSILIISCSVNVAQFVAYKQNDKVITTNKEEQINQQELANLKDLVKQRESRIQELQSQLDKKKEGNTEQIDIEDTYSKLSIDFSKLALGGRISTDNYDTLLSQTATKELSERMNKQVEGEYSGQASIKINFSHEQVFVDLDSLNEQGIKVFVKLNYKYDSTNSEAKLEAPESTAYLVLTLTTEEGALKVSNYEMG